MTMAMTHTSEWVNGSPPSSACGRPDGRVEQPTFTSLGQVE